MWHAGKFAAVACWVAQDLAELVGVRRANSRAEAEPPASRWRQLMDRVRRSLLPESNGKTDEAFFSFPPFSSCFHYHGNINLWALASLFVYFLGLQPLAGYASLKLCHVMSCFLYGWLGYACCPPQPQMMPGMPALGPSRAPTQKADMGSRAPEPPERAAQKEQASPETQMQQNTVNSSVLWLGSRAHARQKGRKQTGQKQGPRRTRASHSKSKTDRTTAHRSAQQFLMVFTAFW